MAIRVLRNMQHRLYNICIACNCKADLLCVVLGNSISCTNYISDIWILHVQTSSSPEAGTNSDSSPAFLETVKQVGIIATADYN